MITGSITGLFATTVGGVPKPRVDSIEVTTQGIRNEIIRDKKHHGGEQKAVCLLTNPIIKELQSTGHPISGGSTGENILLDVSPDLLQPGVQLQFSTVALEITMPAPPCKTISDSFTDGEFQFAFTQEISLGKLVGMHVFSLRVQFIRVKPIPSTQSLKL
jgi:MOSC domain-containing protein YiiM